MYLTKGGRGERISLSSSVDDTLATLGMVDQEGAYYS